VPWPSRLPEVQRHACDAKQLKSGHGIDEFVQVVGDTLRQSMIGDTLDHSDNAVGHDPTVLLSKQPLCNTEVSLGE
jgi:hypothetical protein